MSVVIPLEVWKTTEPCFPDFGGSCMCASRTRRFRSIDRPKNLSNLLSILSFIRLYRQSWIRWKSKVILIIYQNGRIILIRLSKESVQFAFHSFVYIQFAYIDRVEKVKSFIRLYRQSWKSKVALIIYQNARITFNRSAKESVEFAFHSFVYSLIDRVEKVKLH